MPILQTSIQCPRCHSPLSANIEQIIDVGRDPGAKSRLLQGRLNVAQCNACGFIGALASPLVYHDPLKELLLTFVPPELQMPQLEQEQVLGKLTQQVLQSLAPELRKGYLLRPQMMLTMQGLVEKVLEADGITKEMLEAQRAKSKFTQELIEAEPETRKKMIAERDAEIDSTVISLISAYGQAAAAQGNNDLSAKILQTRDDILQLSAIGKKLQTQKLDLEKAAEDLKQLEGKFSTEKLVQIFLTAPTLDRVSALTSFAWQVMDYSFFQRLTERIEQTSGSEKERLTAIRQRCLEDVDRLQQAVKAEMSNAVGLLQSLLDSPDLDHAIEQYLPDFNDVFFAMLEANLETARKNKQEVGVKRLEEVREKILSALEKSLPPDIRLVRDLLGKGTDAEAEAELDRHGTDINENLVTTLKATLEDLKANNQEAMSARAEKLLAIAEKKAALARFAAK